ncbi:MAG: hypothetical protein RR548_05145 [Carnobacterium sp.]|uniref:hypothetical protein n=1 Tax=unclassified Carnobacterium TaxID=257487 RepID=UPI0019117B75|nr:hypothetical protein [Carnobacterium sp. CS13]QQP70593.1 hypothetical protein JHE06_01865 [Carnobacterium sp. CS13]
MIRKYLKRIFIRDYDLFAIKLGYQKWKEAKENTFAIFYSERDAWWFATELPDNKWAVWNDEGQMPHPFTVFSTWGEAIGYLREVFEQEGFPEQNWKPEGYNEGEDVFLKRPDKKMCEEVRLFVMERSFE